MPCAIFAVALLVFGLAFIWTKTEKEVFLSINLITPIPLIGVISIAIICMVHSRWSRRLYLAVI